MPPSQPVRALPAADLLRAIAVVGVVVVHAAHWPSTSTPASASLWNGLTLLSRFCVPVFVVLTGLLIEYRSSSDTGPRSFLTRRARRSLLPWLAWAPVYFLAGWMVTGDITHTAYGAGDWWAGGGGHLYFLVLVPQLYLAYLVWPRGLTGQLALAAAAICIQTGLDAARLSGSLGRPLSDLVVWHGYQLFPFWLGYLGIGIAAGGLLRRRGEPDRPHMAAAALALAIPAAALLLLVPAATGDMAPFADGTGAFLRPTLAPLVLAICAAVILGGGRVMGASAPIRVAVGLLSANALGIYIVQVLVLQLPGRVLFPILEGGMAAQIAGFLLLVPATVALSTGAAVLLARSPLAWTVGVARRPGLLDSRRRPATPVPSSPAAGVERGRPHRVRRPVVPGLPPRQEVPR